jgi:hypothetical protein
MYGPEWWDGTGIMYGPVFVAERWLVNAWPRLFTIQVFALLNVPAVAFAFLLSGGAARVSRTGWFVALAVWLCFRWLYYAFSVAANPEILETLFLSLAWFGASRAKPTLAWVAVVLAAFTKVIPVIFAPLLLLRASRRAVAAAIVTGSVIAGAVGLGQHLTPRQLVLAIVMPAQNTGQTTLQIEHIWPIPSSSMMAGLSSAIARAANLKDDSPSLARVQNTANALTIGIYLLAAFVALLLLRGRHALPEVTRVALSYGLFFALMPLMTFHTHPHTFVFLLPASTAIIAALMEDGARRRPIIFGALFLILYALVGVPAVVVPVDRLLGSRLASSTMFADPIWANLALVLSLSAYAVLRTVRGDSSGSWR